MTPALLSGRHSAAALLVLSTLVALAVPSCALAPAAPYASPEMKSAPVAFIPNAGQTDPSVRFQARALGGMVFFTSDAVTLSLPTSAAGPPSDVERPLRAGGAATLRLRFLGVSDEARVVEGERLPGVANFLLGDDPSRWKTGLSTYSGVTYDELYPGIRVRYEGAGSALKSTYEVEPGADPGRISWQYEGALDARLEEETGAIAVVVGRASSGEDVLREEAPVAWQDEGDERAVVDVRFRRDDRGGFGFELGHYDATKPLVIDPTLVYSTFLGGSRDSYGRAVAVDGGGAVYVAGDTNASLFPTMGAKDPTYNGGTDVFVAKIDPSGSALAYSTFIGGSLDDVAHGIAVDSAGNAVVVGASSSPNYPVKYSLQGVNAGGADVVVTKLNAAGNDYIFSAIHGGVADDAAYGVALDVSGNVYVTGETSSFDFPVAAAFDGTWNGGRDAFFINWSSDGKTQAYSTFLGGAADDVGRDIKVAQWGPVYIVGETSSVNFPVQGSFDPSHNGGVDAFVARLTSGSLTTSTFLGGSVDDYGRAAAIDGAGNVYVVGQTTSNNLPMPVPQSVYTTLSGGKDAFVMRMNSWLGTLTFGTYLGGSLDDDGRGVAVDSGGNVIVTGSTASSNFPVTSAFDPSFNGNVDAFVTKISATAKAIVFSTYLGGSGAEQGADVAVDAQSSIYVTGATSSAQFPTANALDAVFGGGNDAFVTRLFSSGSLAWSTLLGGSSTDEGYGIAYASGANGGVYVVGTTSSNGFPTTAGASDVLYNSGIDVFVLKLMPQGNNLVLAYCTFLGGSGDDFGYGIAVDGAGSAYVTGGTTSALTFPSVAAPPVGGTGTDAFVAKLTTSGGGLLLSARIGGNAQEYGRSIAVDTSGNAYVAGHTMSTNFPTFNAAQAVTGGFYDAFVIKLHPGALDYSTYLGGSGNDYAYGIAVDSAGNAHVAGSTVSTDFPAVMPLFGSNAGGSDAYVAKLDAMGGALIYSTYLGGFGFDAAQAIALDAAGSAYVTGVTKSDDFPLVSPKYALLRGGSDAYLTKIDPMGQSLVFSTYLGGDSNEQANGIAVDGITGIATVTGSTTSPNFPLVDALDTTLGGGEDVFVTKFAATGMSLIYSTYLGGSGNDVGRGVAADSQGGVYITGTTKSSSFPATAGAYDASFNGENDVFVSKIAN